MKPVGKPDARNPHVRFDERGGEPGPVFAGYRAPPRLYQPVVGFGVSEAKSRVASRLLNRPRKQTVFRRSTES